MAHRCTATRNNNNLYSEYNMNFRNVFLYPSVVESYIYPFCWFVSNSVFYYTYAVAVGLERNENGMSGECNEYKLWRIPYLSCCHSDFRYSHAYQRKYFTNIHCDNDAHFRLTHTSAHYVAWVLPFSICVGVQFTKHVLNIDPILTSLFFEYFPYCFVVLVRAAMCSTLCTQAALPDVRMISWFLPPKTNKPFTQSLYPAFYYIFMWNSLKLLVVCFVLLFLCECSQTCDVAGSSISFVSQFSFKGVCFCACMVMYKYSTK